MDQQLTPVTKIPPMPDHTHLRIAELRTLQSIGQGPKTFDAILRDRFSSPGSSNSRRLAITEQLSVLFRKGYIAVERRPDGLHTITGSGSDHLRRHATSSAIPKQEPSHA